MLPELLFTPFTKAEQGAHDENISPQQGNVLVSRRGAVRENSQVSLQLYTTAAEYALSSGVILADTKFEFGLISSQDGSKQLVLIDEVLTPDSSRYWPLARYTQGKSQPSFDKQYLRDWLVSAGFMKGLESGSEGKEGQGWTIDEDIVRGTRDRYSEAVEPLTGSKA
ncbi:hypothetical protein FA15DRAFT_761329 [Coprinopsis marcescibilis]|uniref:Phosphoribosylaminoimidazole-succinocarboxamide synthase n=1 Tax=Coprinopsis marcescibilis TaxID=230819 RepID=A0A5C3K9I8_COPMA|nr:hypothetical protein FA15DRAFT_761329 [Coprinopsis marcescibilis]